MNQTTISINIIVPKKNNLNKADFRFCHSRLSYIAKIEEKISRRIYPITRTNRRRDKFCCS